MLVTTESLTKRYGSFTALDHCSLQIEKGEIFGLLGPNGAGKSTLIRLLMGFLKPTSGTCTIGDYDCYRQSVQVHRMVSYLPGDPRLFRRLRGKHVLKFFASIRGEKKRDAFELADRLELDINRRVGFMSTGMRQKLAIAATLFSSTEIAILDEPTANLDPNVRREVLKYLQESREQGQTILLSSHVLSEIEGICDRVAILRNGKMIHFQGMTELKELFQIDATTENQIGPPQEMDSQIEEFRQQQGKITILFRGDLSPLVRWMAQQNLRNIHIRPYGLQSVYDQFQNGNP